MLLNKQLSRFCPETSPYCSFCSWYPSLNLPIEDYKHLFLTCTFSGDILRKYFVNLFGNRLNISELIFKGHNANENKEILYVNVEMIIVLYLIYNAKQRKKIPVYGSIANLTASIKTKLKNSSATYMKALVWIKENKEGKVQDDLKLMDKVNRFSA